MNDSKDSKLRIIIFTDNPTVSNSYKVMLSNLGFRNIVEVKRLEMVLREAELVNQIGLLIVDFEIGRETVFECIKEIRSRTDLTQVKIFLLIDANNAHENGLAAKLGVNRCIEKPILPKALEEAVILLMKEEITDLLKKNEEEIKKVSGLDIDFKKENQERLLLYSSAVNEVRVLAQLYPWSTYSYQIVGELHRKAGLFSNAIKEYEKVLKIDPKNLDACIALAWQLLKRKQWKRVIKLLAPIMFIRKTPEMLEILGEAYLRTKETEKAIKAFADSIEYSKNISARRLAKKKDKLGKAYLKRFDETNEEEMQKKAVELFKESIDFDPVFISSHLNLYYAYKKVGKSEKARQILKDTLGIIPEKSNDWVVLGKVFLCEEENPSKADFAFKQAIKSSKHLKETYFDIAEVYYSKEPDKALDYLDKSIALEANQPHVLKKRGLIYRKKEIFPASIKNYQEALKVDPQDVSIHLNLAKVLIESKEIGSKEKAVDYLKAALRLREDFKEAREHLNRLASS